MSELDAANRARSPSFPLAVRDALRQPLKGPARLRARSGVPVAAAIASAMGCAHGVFLEGDPVAQAEYYERITESESGCEPRVPVFAEGQMPARPHQELARVTVSCYPGTLELCERRLAAEGCKRKADAVVLLASAGSGMATRQGYPTRSYVTRSGRVVRWTDVPPAVAAPSQAAPRDRDYPWMSLDTWWQRHRALIAISEEERRRAELVFVGDSIVEGWDQGVWEEEYARFGALRLGLGGDRTENVLYRIEHGELARLTPKAVVLLIGTNNLGVEGATTEDIARGIVAVAQRIQSKLPNATVLVLGILPRDAAAASPMRQRVAEANARVEALLPTEHALFIDVGAAFVEADGSISPEVMADYLHPTPKGYRKLANVIQPTLTRLLEHRAPGE